METSSSRMAAPAEITGTDVVKRRRGAGGKRIYDAQLEMIVNLR